MSESYLSFEQFQEVCTRTSGRAIPDAHSLGWIYLHDLGIALNYKDDPRLRETHVLNPHWVTGGIYRILNAKILVSRKGELHFADLSNILPADSYPRGMHMFLLDLMRKFELCFPFPDASPAGTSYPSSWKKQQPEEADQFSAKQPAWVSSTTTRSCRRVWSRIPSCDVMSLSEGQGQWRLGVILEFEHRALVKADVSDKRVQKC